MPWNVALGAVLTAGAITEMIVDGVRSPVVFGAGVLAAAALTVRGRWPFGAALVSLAAFAFPVVVVAHQLPTLGDAPTSISLGLAWLVSVYTMGTARTLRGALAGLSAVIVLCVLYALGPGAPPGSSFN